MDVLRHWTVLACPTCGRQAASYGKCEGTPDEPHDPTWRKDFKVPALVNQPPGVVGKPMTMYRYGADWTSAERGYPHQDADERAEFGRLGGSSG